MDDDEAGLLDWFDENEESEDLLFDAGFGHYNHDCEALQVVFGTESDDGEGSDILMAEPHDTEASTSEERQHSTRSRPFASRQYAMYKIEAVFESIADAILDHETEMAISLAIRPKSFQLTPASAVQYRHERKLCFPGKTEREAWRFTCYLRVLELMYEALSNRVVTTKRDVYYKDPALFGKQAVVDRIVDDFAYTLEVPRSSLNVVAAAKGLIAGAVTIKRDGNPILDGLNDGEGSLIPSLKFDDVVEASRVHWALVVEKEAVFHSLVTSQWWFTVRAQAVLVTGKGYPDVATRALLRRLADSRTRTGKSGLPIFGLFDYDPDGIAIYSTYKFGSAALRHETTSLAVQSIQWVGISSREISMAQSKVERQGLLELSLRDRKKAISMLAWKHLSIGQDVDNLRRELQVMLTLNVKAEIQVLDAFSGGLGAWIERILEEHNKSDLDLNFALV